MSITLTDDQARAVRSGKAWYDNDRMFKPVWTLSGIAGSGKSTIIEFLMDEINLPTRSVAYCAYTGAAVQVMQSKGITTASTLHQTLYNFSKKDMKYYKTVKERQELAHIELFVVDEASMVPQEMIDVMLHFEKPIILVGDHNQLPPVESGENFYIGRPDIRLTEPIRQALDNTIIYMAAEILKGNVNPVVGKYGENVTVTKSFRLSDAMAVDQLLTRTNAMRCRLNKIIRSEKKYKSPLPEVGEKLICKRNNWSMITGTEKFPVYMVNGLQVITNTDFNTSGGTDRVTPILWPNVTPFEIRPHAETILEEPEAYKKQYTMDKKEEEELCFLNYGYAVTGHAMQGSEADTILFNNERIRKGTFEDTLKWLYTCITRARKHAIWVN